MALLTAVMSARERDEERAADAAERQSARLLVVVAAAAVAEQQQRSLIGTVVNVNAVPAVSVIDNSIYGSRLNNAESVLAH
jgi:hypothetical protein